MTGSSLNAFKGTIAQERKLKDVIAKHKDMPGALLPVLQEAQGIYGYLPIEVQQMVADGLEISLSEVYGVATFYSQFSLPPKGEHRISVCLGTACYVKGADKILAAIEEKLDFIISNAIKAGNAKPVIIPETTPVTISNEPISISELAKMLNQSGVKIGEMRLFQFLREKNYLCAFGSEYNLPRQKYIEQGLFIIKSSRVQLPTGQVVEKNTTKVTAKGQEYFINKFIYDQSHNA